MSSIDGGRALRILGLIFALMLALNLTLPAPPRMELSTLLLTVLTALVQTACAGGMVLLVMLDPARSRRGH